DDPDDDSRPRLDAALPDGRPAGAGPRLDAEDRNARRVKRQADRKGAGVTAGGSDGLTVGHERKQRDRRKVNRVRRDPRTEGGEIVASQRVTRERPGRTQAPRAREQARRKQPSRGSRREPDQESSGVDGHRAMLIKNYEVRIKNSWHSVVTFSAR